MQSSPDHEQPFIHVWCVWHSLFNDEEIQNIRNTNFSDILLLVTSAESEDVQKEVFFWRDGKFIQDWHMTSHAWCITWRCVWSVGLRHELSVWHVCLWPSGDPCPQPAQVNASDLQPCTKVTTLNYFDGYKVGFGVTVVALFLFPVGQCTYLMVAVLLK